MKIADSIADRAIHTVENPACKLLLANASIEGTLRFKDQHLNMCRAAKNTVVKCAFPGMAAGVLSLPWRGEKRWVYVEQPPLYCCAPKTSPPQPDE